ncbi:zinc-finger domain-containing protein [Labrys neptuniae]
MAGHSIPHFHNDLGLKVIRVGSKEFMCQGANAPFDHPHIFIDLGSDDEAVCSYCSTLYKYDAKLPEGTSDPAACTVDAHAA